MTLLRPANILWREYSMVRGSATVTAAAESESSMARKRPRDQGDDDKETNSVPSTAVVELKLIDFEDALPFGILIKHAANYRCDPSYPDYDFESKTAKSYFAAFGCFPKFNSTEAESSFVQVAEKRHNEFFFHSIAAWMRNGDNSLSFTRFMKQLSAELRSEIIQLSQR